MKTENDIRKFKLERFCNACTYNNNIGRFQTKLVFHKNQEDTEQKYLWGLVKTGKILEKGWVEYKCPNCQTIVKFRYDVKIDDWVYFPSLPTVNPLKRG